MYTKEQLNTLSSNIGKAIKAYHDAIAENLRAIGEDVPVQGDDEEEEGITVNIEYDGNLFPWLVDRIRWDEEHDSIMVHVSMNNFCDADDWSYLSDLGDATDYVLDAIKWPASMTEPVQLVDLGLTSGTLWADRNIGADSQEEYGDYFRFGEVVPFTEDSPEYVYDEIKGDISGTERDAATVILGKKYCMPTFDQIEELLDECRWEWTTVNDVKGMHVTGPNGNSIFLPASCYRFSSSGSLSNVGSYGYYWSASPLNTDYGRSLNFGSSLWYWSSRRRAYGFAVRPVAKK